MKRTNVYLTEKQVERLHERAEQEGLALAELVRRAVDAFLAWEDPAYVLNPSPRQGTPFHPLLNRQGLSGPFPVTGRTEIFTPYYIFPKKGQRKEYA